MYIFSLWYLWCFFPIFGSQVIALLLIVSMTSPQCGFKGYFSFDQCWVFYVHPMMITVSECTAGCQIHLLVWVTKVTRLQSGLRCRQTFSSLEGQTQQVIPLGMGGLFQFSFFVLSAFSDFHTHKLALGDSYGTVEWGVGSQQLFYSLSSWFSSQ